MLLYKYYPIRKSRTFWSIPLYSEHVCTSECHTSILLTDEGFELVISNKACIYKGTLHHTFIDINSYDMTIPYGQYGPLHNPDYVVINDKEYTIDITFPIKEKVSFKISTTTPTTLRELLMYIKLLYEHIYEEEQRTGTQRQFVINKPCKECKTLDITQCLEHHVQDKRDCSICFQPLNDECVSIRCGHVFDKDCLTTWLTRDTQGGRCPLCRSPVMFCSTCNNSKQVNYTFEGASIPFEFRDITQDRETTDGVYGISKYDLEELSIEDIVYNKLQRRVVLNVGVN